MLDKLLSLLRARLRRRSDWYYLGNGVGLALTHFGRKIFLPGGDAGMTPEIILSGTWEPHVEAVLRRVLKPGMQVAEVGASLGFHTLVMAEAVGPTGHIHAFEPYPKVLPLLRNTLASNRFQGRVTLREVAVLHAPGDVHFAADPSQAGSAHLAIPVAAPSYTESFAVPATRLDDALADVPVLDLLRMDSEGTEGLVLLGAQEIMERSPRLVVVMEWSPAMLAARGDVAELANWIAALGFRCQRIERQGVLTPVTAAEMPNLAHCDVVLSRDGVEV
ncbi:FkbM family methyltransferase [Falsiroseomonas sp.]|uniref:FkbM family methyltransferase n=1 Tax=Falsiroseomonas sp. TaxID=2870721 RepID=UPI00271B1601|nr:FkbM family methyltransferase [Falsiroseomonas sp.]MDO9499188.1 FkbM family methyltransferase [Falsiroseomonas sp.]MDP3416695.1 FkbM family methyltransferase [Falsiroseomonas sp.]